MQLKWFPNPRLKIELARVSSFSICLVLPRERWTGVLLCYVASNAYYLWLEHAYVRLVWVFICQWVCFECLCVTLSAFHKFVCVCVSISWVMLKGCVRACEREIVCKHLGSVCVSVPDCVCVEWNFLYDLEWEPWFAYLMCFQSAHDVNGYAFLSPKWGTMQSNLK